MSKRYLITGGSGFIGTQLCKRLLTQGHTLFVLTRNADKTRQHFSKALGASADSIELIEDLSQFNQPVDRVINLAGQGVMDKRWNDIVKQQLIDSRLQTTQALFDYIQRIPEKPEVLISGSATGVYGISHGDQTLGETATGDDSFSTQLCIEWEKEAKRIETLGIRTCYLRTGIVLGNGGGPLAKMLPPFKLGLGGPMASGKQWMSWVHIDDLLGIIDYSIEHSLSGAINGTAPNPVINKTFTATLGKVLKRPAFFPMPEFVLKLMFGEGAIELLANGQRVIPEAIQSAGYDFKYPQLESALQNLC